MGGKNERLQGQEPQGYKARKIGFIASSDRLLRTFSWFNTAFVHKGLISPDEILATFGDPEERKEHRRRLEMIQRAGITPRLVRQRDFLGMEIWKTGPGEADIGFRPRFAKPKTSSGSKKT